MSAVTVGVEASGAGAILAATSTDSPAVRACALPIFQNLIFLAPGIAVLMLVNVAVMANLADTVDSSQALIATAGLELSIIHFIGLGASGLTEVLTIHDMPILTDTLALAQLRAQGTGSAIAIVHKVLSWAEVADSLIEPIVLLALAHA